MSDHRLMSRCSLQQVSIQVYFIILSTSSTILTPTRPPLKYRQVKSTMAARRLHHSYEVYGDEDFESYIKILSTYMDEVGRVREIPFKVELFLHLEFQTILWKRNEAIFMTSRLDYPWKCERLIKHHVFKGLGANVGGRFLKTPVLAYLKLKRYDFRAGITLQSMCRAVITSTVLNCLPNRETVPKGTCNYLPMLKFMNKLSQDIHTREIRKVESAIDCLPLPTHIKLYLKASGCYVFDNTQRPLYKILEDLAKGVLPSLDSSESGRLDIDDWRDNYE